MSKKTIRKIRVKILFSIILIVLSIQGTWYMVFNSQKEQGATINYLGQAQEIRYEDYNLSVMVGNEKYKIPYDKFVITTKGKNKKEKGLYYVDKGRDMDNKLLYSFFNKITLYKVKNDKLYYVTSVEHYNRIKNSVGQVNKGTGEIYLLKDDTELLKKSLDVKVNNKIKEEDKSNYLNNLSKFNYGILTSIIFYVPIIFYVFVGVYGWYVLSTITFSKDLFEFNPHKRASFNSRVRNKGNGIKDRESEHILEKKAYEERKKREEELKARREDIEAERFQREQEFHQYTGSQNGNKSSQKFDEEFETIGNKKVNTNAERVYYNEEKVNELKRKIAEKKRELARKKEEQYRGTNRGDDE